MALCSNEHIQSLVASQRKLPRDTKNGLQNTDPVGYYFWDYPEGTTMAFMRFLKILFGGGIDASTEELLEMFIGQTYPDNDSIVSYISAKGVATKEEAVFGRPPAALLGLWVLLHNSNASLLMPP